MVMRECRVQDGHGVVSGSVTLAEACFDAKFVSPKWSFEIDSIFFKLLGEC